MTRPAVFGDFAQLTRHHLEILPRSASGARPNPDIVALQIRENFYGLLRVLKIMSRYAADVEKSLQPPGGQGSRAADPWAQAQSEVRKALQGAHLMNPFLHGWRARNYALSARGEIVTQLAAAAETMYAGRDLLQTHFRPGPDGTRQPLTGWSAAIASAPASRALLAEIGGWARQIVTCTADLTTTPTMGNAIAEADQRRLIAMCHQVSVAAAAVQTAQDLSPLPEKDQRQLYAIPVNVLQPRRQPAGAESAADLCRGIAETAERTRHAFAAAVPQAAWSPELTAESLRETVAAAAAISHHSQLIQQALADRAADLGALSLSRKLAASAHSSAQARQAWLSAAGAWESIQTDAASGTPQATAEINDLVLWTGSLAYASPNWRPGRKTAGDRRAPEVLAPGLADISLVADAVHQAATSIVASAAADYTRIRTAALAGRLLSPVETTRSGAERTLFTRATRYQATRLLGAYRDAGAASAKAAGSLLSVVEGEHGGVIGVVRVLMLKSPARRSRAGLGVQGVAGVLSLSR